MTFDIERLMKCKVLQTIATYRVPRGVELHAPRLPNDRNTKRPQFVKPFRTLDGSESIELDLQARGVRRAEIAITRALEKERILPDHTVSGRHPLTQQQGNWPVTLQSDRIGDVQGEPRQRIKVFLDKGDYLGLAKMYPIVFTRGIWGSTGQETGTDASGRKETLTHPSLPKLLTVVTYGREVVPKGRDYVRSGGDSSRQLASSEGEDTVYLAKSVEKIATFSVEPLAKYFKPGSDMHALIAAEAMLVLLAADEGKPDRSGNSALVCQNIKVIGIRGMGLPDEEIELDSNSLQLARDALKAKMRELSAKIYGGKAPSEDLGPSVTMGEHEKGQPKKKQANEEQKKVASQA